MNNKKLLFSITKKDLEITWFSGSGAGGQHRNKHNNCCRIKHIESGAIATGQEQRSREQNKKTALHRLISQPKFKIWHAKKCWEIENNTTVEQQVEEQMQDKNLKIEFRMDGEWVVS